MDILTFVALLFGLAIGGGIAWVLVTRVGRRTSQAEELLARFDRFQQGVEARLDSSRQFLTERVSATERTARELSSHFGHLREASQTILRTNTEILDFQKLLASPSARGGFGEMLLETLLRDILPTDRYALQYTLETGERADAVLKLQDGHIVAVDAKFPLAAYEPLIRANEETRAAAIRAFALDVKRHAKDIATKYISGQDRTLPFAFMYVPAEGVYYEIVRNPELWNAVTSLRVYPVSPNSFVPYIYTVLVGMKGLQIEKEARSILELLGRMQKDFTRVGTEFGKVGSHLTSALHRYEDASKVFDRLRGRVEALGTGEAQQAVAQKEDESAAALEKEVAEPTNASVQR
jgi:DNA recombination protein RmuC